ncbi:Rad4-domain-containing protein [Rhodofomes roseus]|uniref:Rad4-domain-containing protein n=1 Tax=Rhodofomes roseus TaxID=34475 RepID=A0ABQ8KS24_9APHY|nr:Rad4-domain-containing protein [Rhodofomes roseus]KAH9841395.1 Rad4-domain-containing protein [Rhodofomes roseus]
MSSADNSSIIGADSDDDFDWEEVAVPQAEQPAVSLAADNDVQEGSSRNSHIEITIHTERRGKKGAKKDPRAAQLYAERLARLTCHQVHTVCLLANARIRNKWINDRLLHARLLSITPLHLQNAFTIITKARIPDDAERGHRFESAVTRLTEWWSDSFRVESTGHIRNRTFDQVQKLINRDPKGKGKAQAEDIVDDDDGEVIRSEKSLMKHALMMRGSRDTSAQLFTALCRALGIPARLVASLQSVPWQAGVGKPKTPATKKKKKFDGKDVGAPTNVSKGKEKAVPDNEDEDDMDMEEVEIPITPKAKVAEASFPGSGQRMDGGSSTPVNGDAKGKQKAPPVIKLRQSRGRKLGSEPAVARPPPRERTPDPTTTPPVLWTEVFSRADARWIPIDPIRCLINKRKVFDPTPNPNAAVKPDRHRPVRVENRMVYVVAFEEDSFGRDVTPRYAREYGAKVAKVQQGGRGRKEWWERIIAMVKRPYQLHRDDLEDEELQTNQLTEGMPTSMAGFKDHPLYVLERHLKRDEMIYPLAELGKFRGEPVYSRSSVLQLKAAENWMRQGRKVKEGAQPMKWVKQRAMTVNKQRAIELALSEKRDRDLQNARENTEGFASEDGVMQGLYAEHQTELYRPDPIIDGRVPKNDFGNIDLYVPTMLPAGAVHIPYKGTAKIARQLGFDYAEAVTGFEFKKRRAFPVITGIVVAAENEGTILEAYWEAEHEAEQKRRAKREDQVIKRWTKLIHGLRIRQRLQEQYADADRRESSPVGAADEDVQPQGGFLTGADDVVQPYTLPRNLHEVPATSTTISLQLAARAEVADQAEATQNGRLATLPTALDDVISEDGGDLMEEISIPAQEAGEDERQQLKPKTMLELAEAADRRQDLNVGQPLASSSVSSDRTMGQTYAKGARATSHNGAEVEQPAKTRMSRKADKSRGKKRRKASDDSSEAEVEGDEGPSTQASPAKRARKAAPPIPAPTRVLRTRTTKSAAKIQEEKETEEAYRRAVAE